jgi:dolichol kinase
METTAAITIAFLALNALAIASFILNRVHKRKRFALLPIVASFLVAALVVLFLGEAPTYQYAFFVLSFAVLFSLLPTYYMQKPWHFVLILAITVGEFLYAVTIFPGMLMPFIQMFAIGTTAGMSYRLRRAAILKEKNKRSTKAVEVNRDIIQIALGVVIFAIFLFVDQVAATYLLIGLILLGYLYNNVLGNLKDGRVYRIFSSFERLNITYGLGALYLAIGMSLIIGFISSIHFVLLGIIALFFADSAATIIGLCARGPKLFYNKGKTWSGVAAFFATVAVIGYPIIGLFSLLFAFGLALVESINFKHLDDNITIALLMILMYYLVVAHPAIPIIISHPGMLMSFV